MASEGLASAKGFAAKLSATAWLLLGGFALTIISLFLVWETQTLHNGPNEPSTPFDVDFSFDFGLNPAAMFIGFVVIGAAAWLAWPVIARSSMSVKRLAGLSALAGLMALAAIGWFFNVSKHNTDIQTATVGFGYWLYTAATIAIVVAVVLLWLERSRTQTRTY
jgi:hypothetical protein